MKKLTANEVLEHVDFDHYFRGAKLLQVAEKPVYEDGQKRLTVMRRR